MNKLVIDGVTWGEIKLKSGSTYRKLIDGKWTPMRKHEVPSEVVEAFEGVEIPAEDVHEIEESVDIQKEDVNDFGFSGKEPEIDWKAAYEDAITHSTDNLTLKDLADLMYTKFGVYTCYLQREPKQDDVHPITGNLMSNFTRGQARQQYLSAVAAKTNYDPNVMSRILKSRESHFDMKAHREMHPDRFVQPDIEMPTEDNPYADKKLTMKEWREQRASEKPIMNTEHGRRGDGTDEDELYAEPPINGHTIIRPYATNPIAERRLAEKRARRERGY